MNDKRLIFCISPGRCGTGYLAAVLNTIPGVLAVHEPNPSFTDPFREYMGQSDKIARWWQDYKLPSIYTFPDPVYIETSHMFCKGFIEPLLGLGVIPEVIILRRNAREVALSLYRLGCISARTNFGLKYLYKPDDYGVIHHLERWDWMTDYALCYWYAREIEARQDFYKDKFERVHETTTCEITSQYHFMTLVQNMNLPSPGFDYDKMKNEAVHPTEPGKKEIWPPGYYVQDERRVEDALGNPA